MIVLRMARRGAKKRPFYHIVATDSRSPRDGRYLEKVGTYNPMLPKEDPKRVTLVADRIKYWLSQGGKPSDRVARLMHAAGLGEKVTYAESPKKSAPKAKAQERMREAAEAAKAAAEAAAEAREEAPAETPAKA